MERGILKLETFENNGFSNAFRTIIKTQHGRVMYLALEINDTDCTITNCFYTDRNQGKPGAARYSSKPLKLKTFRFPIDSLLSVIEAELDRKFYGVEFIRTDYADLSLDEYLKVKSNDGNGKYHFLIMIGDDDNIDGLSANLCTRIRNKLHRSIYVELSYYKDGKGVVKQCHYYDRQYKREDITVTPPQLISCFFPYNHEGILNLLNNELCCDFTHIIITDGIDLDSNTTPLCGAL